MKRREIDPVEAIRLFEGGFTWDEIGRLLAAGMNRRSPFWGMSVQRAVRDYDRRTTNETDAPEGACLQDLAAAGGSLPQTPVPNDGDDENNEAETQRQTEGVNAHQKQLVQQLL